MAVFTILYTIPPECCLTERKLARPCSIYACERNGAKAATWHRGCVHHSRVSCPASKLQSRLGVLIMLTTTVAPAHQTAIPRPARERCYTNRLDEAPKVLAEIAYVLHLTRRVREEMARERAPAAYCGR